MDYQRVSELDVKPNKFYAINSSTSELVELRYFGTRYVVVGVLFADAVEEVSMSLDKYNDCYTYAGSGLDILAEALT